jgi:RHS repeat-associated protein
MTGTPGTVTNQGGATAAGSSGNGNNSTSLNGANGSGGASGGTSGGSGSAGSGTDSGGGGGGLVSGSAGGNGGQPASGGGAVAQDGAITGGTGGSGEVILTYGTSTADAGATLQDLNYTYDSAGNITQIKSVASSTASTTVHFTYDPLNRLTGAYTNVGPGITTAPHNYWAMNGTSTDSVGGLNGFDTAMSYSTTTGVSAQGAAFNGSTSKINIGAVASGTVNLSVGAWVKTTSSYQEWIIGQNDVGPMNGQWAFGILSGKVFFYTEGGGSGNGLISGNISVNDGTWHYVGASQNGATYSIYVDGVLDVQKTSGAPVSYDPTLAAGIGYDRREAAYYFNGDIDELGVWSTTLSNLDFLTLYNAGIGYVYPYSAGSLATTTYAGQGYGYDALGNFTAKGTNNYTYAQTGYANPDAVTQIANGISTTTLSYDHDGNLTSSGTSTFSWDYKNRLTQAVTQGSTSTYAYDDGLNRVSQTVGNTTTIYPNKFYSITSTTNGGTTYATTTVYVWNGDTLIATIDQPMVNGAATGTAATRYIHPDHLGSTNIVSDETGNIVDDVEYYPYGETRLNQPTYPTNAQRQYIAQFKDGNSLNYLNARYYDSSRGQFESEDPVFLALGDGSAVKRVAQQSQEVALANPQTLNSYSYAGDNPVTMSDPTGKFVPLLLALGIVFEVYAGAQGLVDYYDYQNMNVKYADVTTQEQKRDTKLKLGADVVTELTGQGMERAGYEVAGLGFSVFSAAGDATQGSLYQFFKTSGLNWSGTNGPGSKSFATPSIAVIGQLYSNSAAVRQTAVNTINATTGGNSNSSKLWVTPNGAVITWSGQVVSSKPKDDK